MSIDLVKTAPDEETLNASFAKYIEEKKKLDEQRNIAKLKDMEEIIYRKKISDMTINEFMVNWKMSHVGFVDDVIHMRLNPTTLFGDNRLFFIGFTMVVTIVVFFAMYLMFHEHSSDARNEHVISISLNTSNRNNDSIIKQIVRKLIGMDE